MNFHPHDGADDVVAKRYAVVKKVFQQKIANPRDYEQILKFLGLKIGDSRASVCHALQGLNTQAVNFCVQVDDPRFVRLDISEGADYFEWSYFFHMKDGVLVGVTLIGG